MKVNSFYYEGSVVCCIRNILHRKIRALHYRHDPAPFRRLLESCLWTNDFFNDRFISILSEY
ncbi:hypothetical protein Tcan_06680 [Toxocara canis]|uniref:Uncharacterized protein n=1 Tax=Toxocara canis TaxID=6265 RepID=A0A0B2W4U6_TOXCA|nr:hypothetical protein Tcan_06680 [Toxocara canis]